MSGLMVVSYPPLKEGDKFDMEYYLKTHMPLVEKTWKPHGLVKWEVVQYESGTASSSVQAFVYWEQPGIALNAAMAHGKDVFADVPNFTNLEASPSFGEVMKKSA